VWGPNSPFSQNQPKFIELYIKEKGINDLQNYSISFEDGSPIKFLSGLNQLELDTLNDVSGVYIYLGIGKMEVVNDIWDYYSSINSRPFIRRNIDLLSEDDQLLNGNNKVELYYYNNIIDSFQYIDYADAVVYRDISKGPNPSFRGSDWKYTTKIDIFPPTDA
jgi:hypothetical protein